MDGIIFMKEVSQFGYINGKRLNEQPEVPFSLQSHVPVVSKTPHGLRFHETKWRNEANECCRCERRLTPLWKQILILVFHNSILFDEGKGLGGGNKILDLIQSSEAMQGEVQRMPGMPLLAPQTAKVLLCQALCILSDKAKSRRSANAMSS